MSITCSSSCGSVSCATCAIIEAHSERIGLAERIIGIVDVVLRRDDVGAARQQLLHARDAAALGLAVEPRRADEIDMRIDRNGDACGRHHVDDLGGIDVVVSGHRAAMAGGDAALEAFAHGLEREIFEAARIRVVGVVDQHVDVEIVLLREVEADVDVLARVRVACIRTRAGRRRCRSLP